MKKVTYWIILTLIVYGSIEFLSFCSLLVLKKYWSIEYAPADAISNRQSDIINYFFDQKNNYVSFSPTLGWTIKKNGLSESSQANNSGIRGNKEYAFAPPPEVRRISTFGDSFTECDQVTNNETWQAFMETYHSNLEVINFGVNAFGLDQAYLRYLEEAPRYKSDIVLIGYMSENIYRNVNTYRPFYMKRTGIPFTKPRFVIKNGKLSLIPNSTQRLHDYQRFILNPKNELSKVGANDYYYEKRYKSNVLDWSPTIRAFKMLIEEVNGKLTVDIIKNGQYNEQSEAYKVTKKILDEFYETSIGNGSTPIILIFPNISAVSQYYKEKQKLYAPLLTYFDSTGYRYIDMMDIFENADATLEDLFVNRHYSPLTNKLVAEQILNYLDNL